MPKISRDFKHVKFSERVKNIQIDVTHRLNEHQAREVTGDRSSYFGEALTRWHFEDRSAFFKSFWMEVRSLTQSYAQVVYNRDAVFQILVRHIEVKDTIALPGLLDCLVHLARDLLQEFYPYFKTSVLTLVGLLNVSDASLLENVFTSLAYLFKYLWNFVVQDIKTVLIWYCPLLQSSQREHIRRFAAESMSFLLRKSREPAEVVDYLLAVLNQHPEMAEGFGQLLFSMFRGVLGGFHSCTNFLLPHMLNRLGHDSSLEQSLPYENVYTTVSTCLDLLAKFCTTEKSVLLWSALLSAQHTLLASSAAGLTQESLEHLGRLFGLTQILVSYRKGKHLTESNDLHSHLCHCLDTIPSAGSQETCFRLLSLAVATIDVSHYRKREETALLILRKATSCSLNPACLSELVRLCLDLDLYLKELARGLVPALASWMQSEDRTLFHQALTLIAQLVVKTCGGFSQEFSPEIRGISFFLPHPVISTRIKDSLSGSGLLSTNQHHMYWALVICLPHIQPLPAQDISRLLLQSAECIRLLLHESTCRDHLTTLFFLMTHTLRSYLQLCWNHNVPVELTYEMMTELIRMDAMNPSLLQAFDLFCTVVMEKDQTMLSVSGMCSLLPLLDCNFMSALGLCRKLALSILSKHQQLPFVYSAQSEKIYGETCDIFQRCLVPETVSMSFDDHRARLALLRNLSYFENFSSTLPGLYRSTPIKVLIGNLFWSLSVVWEPLSQIISSFSGTPHSSVLWDCIQTALSSAYQQGLKAFYPQYQQHAQESTPYSWGIESLFSTSLTNVFLPPGGRKPDLDSFVVQLWECLALFPGLAEQKSRDYISLFLGFLRTQCLIGVDVFHTRTSVLRRVEVEEGTGGYIQADHTSPGLSSVKHLLAALKTLSLFKNPRSIYREPELFALYNSLLSHRNKDLQLAALRCLFTYRHSFLDPYREHMERLMQKNLFREELLQLSSVTEDGLVNVEHRHGLHSILIRLLFGKLKQRSGMGTSGKGSSNARRAIIMTFLLNCSESDLKEFFSLMVAPYQYTSSDSKLSPKGGNLTEVIPVGQQLGFLSMLSFVVSRLGAALVPFLDQLLTCMMVSASQTAAILAQQDQVEPSFVNSFKRVRSSLVNLLASIFSSFPEFEYTPYMGGIYEHVVLPQIGKLAPECAGGPTPLLRLLGVWGSRTTYHPFLTFSESVDVLAALWSCLRVTGAKKSVTELVMGIANNLIPEVVESSSTTGSKLLRFEEGAQERDPIAMSPYLDLIFSYICDTLQNNRANTAKKGQPKGRLALSSVTFQVLRKISPYISKPDQCSQLVRMLLVMAPSIRDEEALVSALEAVALTLPKVSELRCFLHPLGTLFATLCERRSRDLLVRCAAALGAGEACPAVFVNMVADLNSWDENFVDEPDFRRRLAALNLFRKVLSPFSGDPADLEMIVQNLVYALLNLTELSLRDGSINCMTSFLKAAGANKQLQPHVFSIILPAVRKGLASSDERIRHDSIGLLSDAVQSLKEHSIHDMSVLLGTGDGMDFFDHVKHIQIQNRGRALQFLQQHLESGALGVHSVFHYLLPIIVSFFKDGTINKDGNVMTEVIAAAGAAAKLLPWPKYLSFLTKFTRGALPLEKKVLKAHFKVCGAILNSFHFDLSELKSMTPEELQVLEQDYSSALVPIPLAAKIYQNIIVNILPRLKRCLSKKASSEIDVYDHDSTRLPFALPIIHLLSHLPQEALDANLPGILFHVLEGLSSKGQDVREAARGTLTRSLLVLGPKYLPQIIKDMSTQLSRGFQMFVLGYTLHSLLDTMKTVEPGSLDDSVSLVVEILNEDIFGELSREREAEKKRKTKVMEAKWMKSYESYEILAKVVSSKTLPELIEPLKKILTSTSSHKVIEKADEVFRKIMIGIHSNASFKDTDLLQLAVSLCNETLPFLSAPTVPREKVQKVRKKKFVDQSIFIIPPDPRNHKLCSQTTIRSNLHVAAKFCLKILLKTFKSENLLAENSEHSSLLSSALDILVRCLDSSYINVMTFAMQCLQHLLRYPLANLSKHADTITNKVFRVIKGHGQNSTADGENYRAVQTAFKTMTVILREIKQKISDKQLKTLLLYAEENIHDYNRQATAVPLLKVILQRKFVCKELHELMTKVRELSLIGLTDLSRSSCRQLMLQYILDYSQGRRLVAHFEFYLKNLQYEHESGRLSCLEMLASVFQSAPQEILHDHCGFFFLPMVLTLSNDDAAACRKLSAVVLKTLLSKIGPEHRDQLLGMTLSWWNKDQDQLRLVSVQVLGLWCELEDLTRRKQAQGIPDKLINLIEATLREEELQLDSKDLRDDPEQSQKDLLLFHTLTTVGKMVQGCCLFTSERHKTALPRLFDLLMDAMEHPHVWVRFRASQLFGMYFAITPAPEAARRFLTVEQDALFRQDSPNRLPELCRLFLKHLSIKDLTEDHSKQTVKNLLYIANIIRLLEKAGYTLYIQKGPEDERQPVNMVWITKKIINLASKESTYDPRVTTKRTPVYQWIASICLEAGDSFSKELLALLLRPLHRELYGTTLRHDHLYEMAQEACELIRKRIGRGLFAEVEVLVQETLRENRIKRNSIKAVEAVADPVLHATKKIKKNIAKRSQAKRKRVEKNPFSKMKKQKMT